MTTCIDRLQKTIVLTPTKPSEISKIIHGLKNGKATGYDGITTEVIKAIKIPLSFPLSEAINVMIRTENYPDILKTAIIQPIFKGEGSKDKPENYRPISLLSILNKIVESVIYSRLYNFIADQISTQQFGFRARSGTENALIEMINDIKMSLDKGNITTGVFLDLSKAFDTIEHKILFAKLEKMGVRGKMLNIFRSYFQERKQAVKVNGNYGDFMTCQDGIAIVEGSLLGPIVYLIYVNDITKLSTVGAVRCYADDTSIFYDMESTNLTYQCIDHDSQLIVDYIRMNKLTLNIKKSNCVTFHSKFQQIDKTKKATFNNVPLKPPILFVTLGYGWKKILHSNRTSK